MANAVRAIVAFVGFLSQTVAALFSEYILFSSPGTHTVSYIILGTETVRPLVVSGLINPTSIAVDSENMRLYVTDSAKGHIVWYQLQQMADGKLVTDGYQRIAVGLVQTDHLAVGNTGDLYFSGKLVLPSPDEMTNNGIFRHSALAIATQQQLNPVFLWDRAFSNETAWAPGPLTVDVKNIYWGNTAAGIEHGSIVRGPITPAHLGSGDAASSHTLKLGPSMPPNEIAFGNEESAISDSTFTGVTKATTPAPIIVPVTGNQHSVPLPLLGVSTAVLQMADNTEEVRGIANSARFIFYSTGNAVYGVNKNRDHAKCGALQTDCTKVTKDAVEPHQLVWDGDGTIYLADNKKPNNDGSKGGIYSFPSGTREQENELKFIAASPGIKGIAFLQVGGVGKDSGAMEQSLFGAFLVLIVSLLF